MPITTLFAQPTLSNFKYSILHLANKTKSKSNPIMNYYSSNLLSLSQIVNVHVKRKSLGWQNKLTLIKKLSKYLEYEIPSLKISSLWNRSVLLYFSVNYRWVKQKISSNKYQMVTLSYKQKEWLKPTAIKKILKIVIKEVNVKLH